MRLPPKPGGHGGRRPGEQASDLDGVTKERFERRRRRRMTEQHTMLLDHASLYQAHGRQYFLVLRLYPWAGYSGQRSRSCLLGMQTRQISCLYLVWVTVWFCLLHLLLGILPIWLSGSALFFHSTSFSPSPLQRTRLVENSESDF